MTWFILAAVSMIAATLLGLATVLRNKSGDTATDNVDDEQNNQSANIAIARQHLHELESMRTTMSEAQYEREKEELKIALIDDLKSAEQEGDIQAISKPPVIAWSLVAGAFVVILSTTMYLITGSPKHIDRKTLSSELAVDNPDPLPSLSEMIGRLEEKLEQDPDNPDNWALAGRTYMAINRYNNAERAYTRLHQLVGDDPDVLAAWADASIMANGRKYNDKIVQKLERALELNPEQINALWLLAMSNTLKGDQQKALRHWRRLLPLTKDSPEVHSQVKTWIERTESLNTESGKKPQVR